MTPQTARREFTEYLDAQGLSLPTLTAAPAMDAVLSFYAEVRADGCDVDADADMLLFQWGTEGDGTYLDMTRQFIVDDGGGDDGIFQLSLTFRYGPQTSPVECGNEWCSTPDERSEFAEIIQQIPAFLALAPLSPGAVTLTYENAR